MTVRQLATKAEEQVLERYGLSLATALVLCPSRDSAIPFYDTAADYVGAEVRRKNERHFCCIFPLIFASMLPCMLLYVSKYAVIALGVGGGCCTRTFPLEVINKRPTVARYLEMVSKRSGGTNACAEAKDKGTHEEPKTTDELQWQCNDVPALFLFFVDCT